MSTRKTNKDTVLPQNLKAVSSNKQLPGISDKINVSLFTDFSHVLDYLPQGIRIINNDYIVQNINRSFSEISGISPEEVVGKKCWEVFPSPFCHTDECRLKHILEGKQMVQAEIERQKRDGSTVPCMVSAFPLKDKTGKLIGVLESFRDITEKKQLQAQVEETEERYRALIELGTEAGEAIVMLQDIDGKEGIQTFVSDQWIKITGYTREELLGTSFFELESPKGREASIKRHRVKMSGKSVPGLYEMEIVRKDGVEVPIELTGAYTAYRGKPANVVYIRDITRRKQAEQSIEREKDRYLQLLEYTPVAMWEDDHSLGMPFINKLKASGVTDFDRYFNEHTDDFAYFLSFSKSKIQNQAALKLYGPDIDMIWSVIKRGHVNPVGRKTNGENTLFLKSIISPIAHMIEGRPGIPIHEYPLPTATGKNNYVQASFFVMPGHEHDLSLVYGAAIDITDRVNAENELRDYKNHLEGLVAERTSELRDSLQRERDLSQAEHRLLQELEEKIELQVEFIRRLVHDFKTPLLPMLGASEMLLQHTQDEDLKLMALNINRGARVLADSVNDLIDVMRGEIGILNLECSETSIADIVREVVEFLTFEVERKKQHLSAHIEKKLPLIWADHSRLHQVVINLLENSLRYTPSGGKIALQAKRNKDDVVVEVIDTGPGIKEADKPFIFQPYYSTERRFRQTGGLGLGLPLSKMIVELHGGHIWAKNQPDGGANIGFSIPIRQYGRE